jgi:excisionase family DNA binding protein
MRTDDEVLTAEQVAALLRVSTKTVLRLARQGDLPGRKIGRAWRFARVELLEILGSATSEGRA